MQNKKQETGDIRGNTRNLRGTSLKHQQQTDKDYMENQGLQRTTSRCPKNTSEESKWSWEGGGKCWDPQEANGLGEGWDPQEAEGWNPQEAEGWNPQETDGGDEGRDPQEADDRVEGWYPQEGRCWPGSRRRFTRRCRPGSWWRINGSRRPRSWQPTENYRSCRPGSWQWISGSRWPGSQRRTTGAVYLEVDDGSVVAGSPGAVERVQGRLLLGIEIRGPGRPGELPGS